MVNYGKVMLVVFLIGILVANLILFAAGQVSMTTFWLIIGVGFLIAKFVLPNL